MPAIPAKQALRDELLRRLGEELAAMERAQASAREGATHAEAKPENDKDTRALEQSYLARGQALRVEDLRAALAEVQGMALRRFDASARVALSAVVTIEEAAGQSVLFIAPHGGGAKLAEGLVQVVTPKSPLGRALVGKREGDECEVVLAARTREIAIIKVE